MPICRHEFAVLVYAGYSLSCFFLNNLCNVCMHVHACLDREGFFLQAANCQGQNNTLIQGRSKSKKIIGFGPYSSSSSSTKGRRKLEA